MLRPALLALVVSLAGLAPLAASEPEQDGLVPFFERDSLAWRHVRHHQIVDGLRVLEAGASRHEALREPGLVLWNDDRVPTEPRVGGHEVGDDGALAAAWQALGAIPAPAPAPEAAWLWHEGALLAVYEATLPTAAGDWRVVVDGATGRALRVEPLSLAATGRVFGVNPIVATQDATLRDNRLSLDDGSFADAYVTVEVGNVTGPRFGSERVVIADGLTLPGVVPSYEFERPDPRFLETMVYVYVERALDEVAAAGFPELLDYQVQARAHWPVFQNGVFVSPAVYPDAHAGNGMITFIYRAPTPAGPGFGSGAEDAEIIVHELGHLIHFAAAPDAAGDWRYIWGEGNGDILAALVLEPLSQGFGDPCVSEWLATYYEGVMELFPYEDLLCIRVLENDLRMPEDFFGDLTYQWSHENGQFWSGALWDIRQEIGREETLTLFLESLHFMPAKAEGFEDLGETVLLADLGLTGGAREEIIRAAFARKGIELPALATLTGNATGELAPAAARDDGGSEVPAAGMAALVVVCALVALGARRRR